MDDYDSFVQRGLKITLLTRYADDTQLYCWEQMELILVQLDKKTDCWQGDWVFSPLSRKKQNNSKNTLDTRPG